MIHAFIKQSLKNFYDIVIILIWLKMMHKFSCEHNRSKIRVLHPKLIGKIYLEPNYANIVIKNNKITNKLWQNCSSHGHNIEHNWQIL